MTQLIDTIKNSFASFDFVVDILDMALVAIIIYSLLKFTKKTRAMQVIKGLGIIIIVARICEYLQLQTMSWVLNYIINAGAVLLVIVFQPEIRRALEKIGRGKIFDIAFNHTPTETLSDVIEEIIKSVLNLSKHKIGALIVFERKTALGDVIESGTILNAAISSELIENIFFPNTPLHDGAMIIHDDVIVAAGCFLPLSDNKNLPSELGTRHRAGIGISEVSDCITILVSEETGVISMAKEGRLTRYLDSAELREILEDVLITRQKTKGARQKSKGAVK